MSPTPAALAARRLYEQALLMITDEEGVHVQTASALLGAALGMALYRKHHPPAVSDAEVGEPVDSEVINLDAPNVLAAIEALAKDSGIAIDTVTAADVPPEHEPLQPPVELLRTHGSALWQVLTEAGLSPEDRILASIIAALFIVKQAGPLLPLGIVSSLVMRGFVAGAKARPPA